MAASIDDLVSMAIFARVVEAKSFTGAASSLDLSKSVVSARVSAFEERLGARLLHRTTRHLSLTEEGARIYEKCASLLSMADEASESLASVGTEPEGVVRMSIPSGLGFGPVQLPRVLRDFFERYPRVKVDLSLSDSIVDLLSKGLDVALFISSTRLINSALIARRLWSERTIVCGAPSYFALHGVPALPHDLLHHNCIHTPQHREWTFHMGKQSLIVPVSGSLVTDSLAMLRQAALEGTGLVTMPMPFVSADLAAGRLRHILQEHPLDERAAFIVHPYRKHMPTKVRVIVDFLVERLRVS